MKHNFRFVMKKIIDTKPRDKSDIESEYQENLKRLTSENSVKSYFSRKSKSEIELKAKKAIKDYGTCQLSDEFYVSNQYVQHCEFDGDFTYYSFVSSKTLTTERCTIGVFYPSKLIERWKKLNAREDFKEFAHFFGYKFARPVDIDDHADLMSLLSSKNITGVTIKTIHYINISLESGETLPFPVKFGYVIFGICEDDISKSEQFKNCKMVDI